MSNPFCKHRWTNIKTWMEKQNTMLCAIQRCRYCNEWQRLDADVVSVEKRVSAFKDFQHSKDSSNIVGESKIPNSNDSANSTGSENLSTSD